MMISPELYLEEVKDATYEELIRERKRLVNFINTFEKREKAGDRSGEEWKTHPMPNVRYQLYLEYLSVLCSFMAKKYNQEYAWD